MYPNTRWVLGSVVGICKHGLCPFLFDLMNCEVSTVFGRWHQERLMHQGQRQELQEPGCTKRRGSRCSHMGVTIGVAESHLSVMNCCSRSEFHDILCPINGPMVFAAHFCTCSFSLNISRYSVAHTLFDSLNPILLCSQKWSLYCVWTGSTLPALTNHY